jgi:hypothetical protein
MYLIYYIDHMHSKMLGVYHFYEKQKGRKQVYLVYADNFPLSRKKKKPSSRTYGTAVAIRRCSPRREELPMEDKKSM